MDKKATVEMIKHLSDLPGISGFEDAVVEDIRGRGRDYGSFEEDSLRNLYLYRKGNSDSKPVVQLDAHTDEVGFMVRAIRPNGQIEFMNIGGWVDYNIPAHQVKIINDLGEPVPAVIASKPPHYMSKAEREAPLDISKATIDVGVSSAEELARDYHISVAAPVVPDVTCTFNEKNNVFMGKAFDNRMGCASILKTLDVLKGEKLDVNIVGAFAAQEEVGIRGAKVTVNHVRPDIAICFEGCPADDTFLPEYQSQTVLGKGPMLRAIDNSMITNPRFQKYALNLAEECGIPVQVAVRTGGSTNGGAIHLGANGVPCIVIGIPVRYAHTHYCYSSYNDFENGVRLACEILRRLNADVIRSF